VACDDLLHSICYLLLSYVHLFILAAQVANNGAHSLVVLRIQSPPAANFVARPFDQRNGSSTVDAASPNLQE
jgi:hypothetical protein